MSRRREACRNFQRGSCDYGDRCRFLHVSQQQSRPNSFGFGSQNNSSQFFNANQQQKPNPFGFGVQNGSGPKGTPSFGVRNDSPAKPFENKWIRPSSTSAPNYSQQASTQPQAPNHQCSDPESCKHQIAEDFKNELPLWRLTCYGHWKNRACDIVGDVSYEELRAAAYEDAKKGLPLQAIIDRERNLYNSKCAEFDNLLRNPYVISSNYAETKNFAGANNTMPSMCVQNNAPAQSNAPPLFSSFSQMGASSTVGPNLRPTTSATPPNSIFGQPNVPQYNNQNAGGNRMKFGNSGSFTNQPSTLPSGTSPFPNSTNFQNGFMAPGSNPISSALVQTPFANSTQWSSSPDAPRVTTGTVHQESALDKQEDGADDSIWLKNEWAVGEIPMVAPPARFCT
ncbi:uncharacterized protein A4U43_C05F7210 [Asparagus officinalis]|uniref:C3H1-type domain-containing protein n=1 Tax=Asparagus officinalis TaxID=4686 RepID=A0A5P1EVD9_ASPOF|nr:zinc finger CCCH domain-containing protein 46 isoform X1 [Asparagus officinalis]XP_020267310.1 zinc finger CCCH domain-containing protein 46 isoform X2 [Asparagus officinalis]ONK68080.1 uncharacterized protein A4U43_C05F7210 [Asparagus officinalis]